MKSIKVSVIVPAHDAETMLPRCLDAIAGSSRPPHEVLVVDDRSNDGTADVARRHGAVLLQTTEQSGPGAARNLAAERATGEILFFVDADVVVAGDAVERVARSFEEDLALSALFGSYDEEPAETNFLSQYKNLFHHYVHQQSGSDAGTFWAGCGAIRRDVFLEVGGFDAERYPRPAIEDIELGYRLRRQGHRIVLDKGLQAKHLKRWTLGGLLHADILARAVPWTRLILETKTMDSQLNLRLSDRVSAVLVWLSVLCLPLAVPYPWTLALVALLVALVLIMNRDFYAFFFKRKGALFALGVVPMHLMYYLYSAGVFGLCRIAHTFGDRSRA